MYPLTNLFYKISLELIKQLRSIPGKIYAIIYDPRFTPDCVINDVKNNIKHQNLDEYYSDSCYFFIMQEFENVVNNIDLSTYVCDSSDLSDREDMEDRYGDYLFYTGMINEEVPYLYMASSHLYAYPSKLILYGPEFQIEVSEDRIAIDVYEVNVNIRNVFFISNEDDKMLSIRDFLSRSDIFTIIN